MPGAFPVGLAHTRDSLFHCHPNAGWWAFAAPMALHPGRVLGEAAESAAQNSAHSEQAAGLWAIFELSLPDSHAGTDEGAHSQHRSGHVHPEQELRGRNWKRRRTQRKKVRAVKQACSDTIEETISSTDEVAAQRKRARVYKGSAPPHTSHWSGFALLAALPFAYQQLFG